MGKPEKYISPYSADWESEKSFFFDIVLEEQQLPRSELSLVHKWEVDLHESKAATGTLVIGSSAPTDSFFGRQVREHMIWKAGRRVTFFAGPREDVNVFPTYYVKAPVRYSFNERGVVATVKFQDASSRMGRRKRQRRFKGWTAKKVAEDMAERYGLLLVAPDSMGNVLFDDELSLSQVNEFDNELLSRLCSYFGYRWRVDGTKLVIYHPDVDVSVFPKTYYTVGFRCGDFSVERFKPKVKRVVVPLKPKNITAGLDDPMPHGGFSFSKIKVGNKSMRLPSTVAGQVQAKQKQSGATTLTPAMKSLISQGWQTHDRRWKEVQKWHQKIEKNPSLGDVNVRIRKHYFNSDAVGALMFEDYEKRMTGRSTSDWITAEVVLAYPTTRLKPGLWLHIQVADSQFFSGLYKIKRAKISLNRKGFPAVVLVVKRRAWSHVYWPKRFSSAIPLIQSSGVGSDSTALASRSVGREWRAIHKKAKARITAGEKKLDRKMRESVINLRDTSPLPSESVDMIKVPVGEGPQ